MCSRRLLATAAALAPARDARTAMTVTFFPLALMPAVNPELFAVDLLLIETRGRG
jgi:hypothetical protein